MFVRVNKWFRSLFGGPSPIPSRLNGAFGRLDWALPGNKVPAGRVIILEILETFFVHQCSENSLSCPPTYSNLTYLGFNICIHTESLNNKTNIQTHEHTIGKSALSPRHGGNLLFLSGQVCDLFCCRKTFHIPSKYMSMSICINRERQNCLVDGSTISMIDACIAIESPSARNWHVYDGRFSLKIQYLPE